MEKIVFLHIHGLHANPAHAIIKTRKPLLPLLGERAGVRAGFFPTILRFLGRRDLQNWMHIGTMNHPKRSPEPPRGGLFVAMGFRFRFPSPLNGVRDQG